ncbi:hypothetical protein GKQ38_04350 [Candidatus Nanohaloarchaea archaeon]|nr:hypothetical protein GKQ38_04350 [Candidatus Nanohaloarchaea archaeon]
MSLTDYLDFELDRSKRKIIWAVCLSMMYLGGILQFYSDNSTLAFSSFALAVIFTVLAYQDITERE